MTADAASRSGAVERALALADEALTEVGEQGPPDRRTTLLVRRGVLLTDLGRDEEALGVLEQAVGLLPADPPTRLRAQALGSLARTLARIDQIERAGELARQALAAADAAGAVEEKLDAQLVLGPAMVYGGDVDAGLALLREIAVESRRIGLLWVATRAFIGLSDQELMLARYDAVIRTIDEGVPLAEEAGVERTVGAFLRGNKGEALMRSGRWGEAMAVAASSAEPPGVYAGTLALLRAELHVLSGRLKEAELELRDARRHLRRSSAAQFLLPMAVVEAELTRSRGDLEAARDILERALARTDISEEHRYKWPVLSLAARIEAERALTATDKADVARMAALREVAAAMAATTTADRAHRALVDAEATRLAGAGEVEAWSTAVGAWRETGEPFGLAYALLRHAAARSAAGDIEAASASAREALELAEAMGAAPLTEAIEALVRRARLRTVTPGNGAPERADLVPGELERLGLTAREIEVLTLVADGHSNGQIAERLVISRKTASVHVSHILSKLGVSSRVEAAAMAHRLGLMREAL